MTSVEPTAQVSQVTGIVHGGQQPVSGALIQVIAPGTTGYGSAGSVVVSTTTDANGNFALPAYTCPTGNVLVYLLATGGNPGAGTNSSLAEAAILGPCSGLTSSTFVYVSEVTTVAAAYTLAPFASVSGGAANIGTSSTNLIGLRNAAAAAGNLASTATGQAGSSTASITLPTAEMNTLADILAACVNTGVGSVSSTTCATLFSNATPPGGTAPTDTFQAAIDIALNPGHNASTLYSLASASPPYQPTLFPPPNDFALGIVYTGGSIAKSTGPQGIDIDAQGNAWVSILGLRTVPNGLLEISPAGVVSPSTGAYLNTMVNPDFVAVNSGGMVEVVDYSNGVFEYAPAGSTGPSFTQFPNSSGLSTPIGVAIDNSDSSSWITNLGNNTMSHISASGVLLTSTPLATGSGPFGIAFDASRDIIIADSDSTSTGANSAITKYSPTGPGTYNVANYSTGSGTTPYFVAIDNSGDIWTPLLSGGVLELSPTGSQISPAAGYISSTNNLAISIELDGLNRAIVSNINNNPNTDIAGTVTVFSNNGTLISTSNSGVGYSANGTIASDLVGMALDASGNCWISGNTPSAVTEIIGIAAPVATPIAAQSYPTNRLGTKP